ncbi:glycine betaine/proline transport system permease protein [Sinosporangium album]|uniref:Glycine betaine/proline transport system permease protein n=1 Tax=Sinosporangium album TaxID=504805 RepID=A0A1G7VAU0_9ACTN|nr:ABC transporter permease subunit [Sinosporangium album]SDG56916.1 glycine betaine/proline transport system permease protein [Sinosporangium album]
MTAPAAPATVSPALSAAPAPVVVGRPGSRLPRVALPAAVTIATVATVGLYLAFRGTATLPHDDEAAPFLFLNDVRDWVDDNRNESPLFLYLVNYVRLFIGGVFDLFAGALRPVDPPLLVAAATALGWFAGGWRTALVAGLGFGAFGVLGVWEASVDTLALVLTAVLLSLLVGLPLGVWAGRVPRVRRALTPALDVMQIMPTFAYLGPMVLFFQIGPASAAVATIIYAIPPSIRITALAVQQVSPAAVEASTSLGATRWQTLLTVHLPMARNTIVLAVGQTVMMALSMVVFAALIAAPGLGSAVIRGLSRADVGVMLPAGLAIVLMGIVLDRLIMAGARRTGHPGGPGARRPHRSRSRYGTAAVAGLVFAGGAVLGLTALGGFPAAFEIRIAGPVNEAVRWMQSSWYDTTEAIKNVATEGLLNPLQTVLTTAPWWLTAATVAALAWRVSGVRRALTALGCLLAIALLGLWEHSMETLTTVVVAVALTLAAGVALGVAAARSPRFAALQRPLLDAAQTLPAFIYLLPALALFGATRFTAVFASVVYAVPPVVRLVEDGIRGVPPTVVEAALAGGSTRRQLLWKVQLPMARRAVLLAANQGIVMTLAMVVVGGLVGAGGLGFDVVSGFSQSADFGLGFAAGLATVLLGIMLDRITQGVERRPSPPQQKMRIA